MPIWEPDNECISRDQLRQVQLERLQATLNRVYRNVSFYREVVRVHTASGTMTNPRVVGYTRQDLRTWSNLVARVLSASGVVQDDVIQVAFGYGLLTGGLGIHYGAERIGASVLPTSVGRTERQVKIMQDFRSTVLVSTPSYALVIADRMDAMKIDAKTLSLKCCVCAGEPWTEAMRREIEERLFVKATDNYGISEVIGPGVAGECLHQTGMHLNEDHFYAEIIDPESGRVLGPGVEGELVITTLTKEAFPVIRYRTGDLTSLMEQPCACGRTMRAISRITGRSDDVVVIKGINIHPARIGDVLEQIRGERPPFQLVAMREKHRDQLEIRVEITEQLFYDKMREQKTLVESIQQKVANFIGISPRIKLVESGSLEREQGKVKQFIDRRGDEAE